MGMVPQMGTPTSGICVFRKLQYTITCIECVYMCAVELQLGHKASQRSKRGRALFTCLPT